MVVVKRSIMTVYTSQDNVDDHRVRLVLAEKAIVNLEVVYVDPDNPPADLIELNPELTTPTLVDRGDLILHGDIGVMTEYLDDRFPHPPLMPAYPVQRAKMKMMIKRIERDWYSLIHKLEENHNDQDTKDQLVASLLKVRSAFAEMPFFLSTDFTLVDCTVVPLLWRLNSFDIELPEAARPIIDYAERMFKRKSFQISLNEIEYDAQEVDENESI
tara:strand:+ start:1576 stop:2220 length:645 start_codon:yes stop_codon:yes gene_type:complete